MAKTWRITRSCRRTQQKDSFSGESSSTRRQYGKQLQLAEERRRLELLGGRFTAVMPNLSAVYKYYFNVYISI